MDYNFFANNKILISEIIVLKIISPGFKTKINGSLLFSFAFRMDLLSHENHLLIEGMKYNPAIFPWLSKAI
jgi:hypothetical protein